MDARGVSASRRAKSATPPRSVLKKPDIGSPGSVVSQKSVVFSPSPTSSASPQASPLTAGMSPLSSPGFRAKRATDLTYVYGSRFIRIEAKSELAHALVGDSESCLVAQLYQPVEKRGEAKFARWSLQVGYERPEGDNLREISVYRDGKVYPLNLVASAENYPRLPRAILLCTERELNEKIRPHEQIVRLIVKEKSQTKKSFTFMFYLLKLSRACNYDECKSKLDEVVKQLLFCCHSNEVYSILSLTLKVLKQEESVFARLLDDDRSVVLDEMSKCSSTQRAWLEHIINGQLADPASITPVECLLPTHSEPVRIKLSNTGELTEESLAVIGSAAGAGIMALPTRSDMPVTGRPKSASITDSSHYATLPAPSVSGAGTGLIKPAATVASMAPAHTARSMVSAQMGQAQTVTSSAVPPSAIAVSMPSRSSVRATFERPGTHIPSALAVSAPVTETATSTATSTVDSTPAAAKANAWLSCLSYICCCWKAAPKQSASSVPGGSPLPVSPPATARLLSSSPASAITDNPVFMGGARASNPMARNYGTIIPAPLPPHRRGNSAPPSRSNITGLVARTYTAPLTRSGLHACAAPGV